MDERLIFRYRSRTIKSRVRAGWVRSSAASELLRLSVQALAPLGVRGPRRGEARKGNSIDTRLQEKRARGMPRASVPQTDTGGRA
jgi:hypothetical protein